MYSVPLILARLQTPNLFLDSNETAGNENEDPKKYLVTLHVFNSDLPPKQVPHGKSSDMTRGSGLRNPPAERHLDDGIVPRNVLLDVSYAVALLTHWAPDVSKPGWKKTQMDIIPVARFREVKTAKERRGRRTKGFLKNSAT